MPERISQNFPKIFGRTFYSKILKFIFVMLSSALSGLPPSAVLIFGKRKIADKTRYKGLDSALASRLYWIGKVSWFLKRLAPKTPRATR